MVVIFLLVTQILALIYAQAATSSPALNDGLPESGYFVGTTNNGMKIPFKISSRNSGYVNCSVIRIMNSEKIKEVFTRTKEVVNSRNVWANDDGYVLFYLPPSSDAEFGTWLIGNEAGVDAGVAYWKPSFSTLTPLHRDASWYWTVGKVWTLKADTSVECIEGDTQGNFFSSAAISRESRRTGSELVTTVLEKTKDGSTELSYSYFDTATNNWVELDSVSYRLPKGTPFTLTSEKTIDTAGSIQPEGSNTDKEVSTCHAVVVNEEFLYDYYRLMIRCLDTDTEYFLNFGDEGLYADSGKVTAALLSVKEKSEVSKRLSVDISSVSTGDFVWMWFVKRSSIESKTDDLLVKCIGSVANRRVFQ